ncbi:S8 family serine peptidase [Hymenobacter aranciens]|uniref:S8 family serine peptidase n=1 Tax=Hymenobacter aranciens TaxID=3063996 RepID=UPI00272A6C6D|nr:S8 family serine peptidase [Hymenobacter sp. ASUV-10]
MLALPLALLLGLAARPAVAQGVVRRHLVYFRDKANSPYAVSRPQEFLSARALARRSRQNIAVVARDLPVNPSYVAQVRGVAGVRLLYTSRWFNSAVVSCDSTALRAIAALPSVRQAQTLSKNPKPYRGSTPTPAANTANRTAGTRAQYGPAFKQNDLIGAIAMHDAGFRGEGMQIAVFDAGFPGVDQIPALAHLFAENRVLGTRNFVDGNKSVYLRNNHGTNCLSTIAGNREGFYIGTAPKASFYLCITEDASSEHPVEEANWLAAAEYADSVGVDIISSSLGYSEFDAPSTSYVYADMNGHTAISTRAATMAARVGMLVVSAAGNEGNSAWRYITAPADADSIMTVGAVDSMGRRASFSSYGPTADGRVKPTLVSMGLNSAVLSPAGNVVRGSGTSFACPILAGMIAGVWQANPTLTAQQIIQALSSTSSQPGTPNSSLGYGLPNFTGANTFAKTLKPPTPEPGDTPFAVYPNPTDDGMLQMTVPLNLRGQPLQVRIIDSRGRLVTTREVTAAAAVEQLPLPGIAKGLYICQIIYGKDKQSVQFVRK